MEDLMQRLECAVTSLEKMSITMQASSNMANGNCVNGIGGGQSLEVFDVLLKGPLSDYLNCSRAIGSEVEKHAEMVNEALQTQRAFLQVASTHQEPAQTELHDLLKPISDHIQEIQNFRERNRGSPLFNHLSAVSESIPALGWVAVSQKPGPYVKEMNDAATFYTNRVLKDYKETDKRHVDWVHSYLSIWTEMQSFIKQHHTTGLVWSKTGPIAPASLLDSPLTPGAPCPPPPPGPPPVFTEDPCQPQADGATPQHSALFAQLNQGMDITKGLKHVSDEQKTHKNPNLRSQASPGKNKDPKPVSSAKAAAQKRPPLLELEGKKWRVENFEQKHDLVIDETELKQVVYVFGCSNSTLQIKGKINSIIVDNCKKLGLVFENAVGIVEIINSRAIQLQVLGTVPTISINKTEGCQVYLSKAALNCDIVSAKSSEMNILIPVGEDDYKEFPVPEQFKTVWDGSKLVTEPTEIAG
ncbi:PREDICTED: adenylyl cyclase-associated protein 2 isoform X2 [Cyprinodon variegatus]|uniref:Cyclase associated actin cytoskeleton regulatory protein 2 n=1 Tax=Cyprinodon variegatus TaxID=28743 RepID=A0A3Q2DG61_CYPVA|nr:PREDICTED: adenylyl cyclase-associated protein 2 isoform X1 [Cyprinodon variegatus]XP_015242471.1 PREDICTED: adenylyl cyclase-associated protein 2 isoform X1 [Cyprinodon variegatus]XP_015242472.1 PREDICTED: adenylyl cyclase-associated protein 2 isoform X2 [Cyprinodon variegatus]